MANQCYNDYVFEAPVPEDLTRLRDFFNGLYRENISPADFYNAITNDKPNCDLIADSIIYVCGGLDDDLGHIFTLQTCSNWWPDHEIIMRLVAKLFPGIRCYYCVECPEKGFYECNDVNGNDYFLKDENGDFYEDAGNYKPGFVPDCSMRKQKGAYPNYDSFKKGEQD